MLVKKIKEFYKGEIENNFLPYWLGFVDEEYGGLLNCISNDCKHLISDEKYAWSEGRWLWVLSRVHRLYRRHILDAIDIDRVDQSMKSTFDFIINHVIYDDYRCCHRLSRTGQKIKDARTGRYDASIYTDCFVLIGIASYISEMDKSDSIFIADRLAASILRRLENNDYLTEPYPIPSGYMVHGVPMISINTFEEYCRMKNHFKEDALKYREYANGMVSFILDSMYDNKYELIREHRSNEVNAVDCLIDRHINPGHTIEDVWFWIENLEARGEVDKYIDKIKRIFLNTFNIGWDLQYGGLLRFVDIEGDCPKGKLIDTPYERLIMDSWDIKLWWPHSELLYVSLLLHTLTGEKSFLDIYQKCFDYVYSTFPSVDTGEWIQIRKRNGEPLDKVAALPLKDPFHIMRNMIKILEL